MGTRPFKVETHVDLEDYQDIIRDAAVFNYPHKDGYPNLDGTMIYPFENQFCAAFVPTRCTSVSAEDFLERNKAEHALRQNGVSNAKNKKSKPLSVLDMLKDRCTLVSAEDFLEKDKAESALRHTGQGVSSTKNRKKNNKPLGILEMLNVQRTQRILPPKHAHLSKKQEEKEERMQPASTEAEGVPVTDLHGSAEDFWR